MLPVVALAAREAGASVAGAGLTVALVGVGAMVFDLPAGSLVDRLGERRAMVVGTVLLVVSLTGCVLAPTAAAFAACTLLVGCGWAMWFLARLSYVGAVMPPHLRGRALSTLGGVHRVGSFCGPFVSAGAIAWLGLDGAYLVHVVLAAAACVVLVRAPELPGRHPGGRAPAGRAAAGRPPAPQGAGHRRAGAAEHRAAAGGPAGAAAAVGRVAGAGRRAGRAGLRPGRRPGHAAVLPGRLGVGPVRAQGRRPALHRPARARLPAAAARPRPALHRRGRPRHGRGQRPGQRHRHDPRRRPRPRAGARPVPGHVAARQRHGCGRRAAADRRGGRGGVARGGVAGGGHRRAGGSRGGGGVRARAPAPRRAV